jgi:hypothetical protein
MQIRLPRPQRPDRKGAILHSRRQIPCHAARLPDRLRGLHSILRGTQLALLTGDSPNGRLYIADHAGSLRSATITCRLTSITEAYQSAGS